MVRFSGSHAKDPPPHSIYSETCPDRAPRSENIARVVSIQPDKFLGLLGDHEDFPVESIQVGEAFVAFQ